MFVQLQYHIEDGMYTVLVFSYLNSRLRFTNLVCKFLALINIRVMCNLENILHLGNSFLAEDGTPSPSSIWHVVRCHLTFFPKHGRI